MSLLFANFKRAADLARAWVWGNGNIESDSVACCNLYSTVWILCREILSSSISMQISSLSWFYSLREHQLRSFLYLSHRLDTETSAYYNDSYLFQSRFLYYKGFYTSCISLINGMEAKHMMLTQLKFTSWLYNVLVTFLRLMHDV